MPKRRVLAICSDPDQLRRIVGNLEHAGADVDAVRALDASDGASIEQSCVVLALGEGDMAMVSRLAAMLPPRSDAVIVTPRGRLADFTQYLADPRINHVLAGAGDEFDLDLAFTARKIVSGDIFGAEKYLAAGAELQYARLHDYDGRNQAIDGVLAYAESVGMRRQVRTAIGQVCEELLMNALYDAPVDAAGKQVFADLDPRERTNIASPKPVSIRYAATESNFVVSVRDRFGRLAKSTMLSYIDKCLHAPEQLQIDRKTYGAGLGLYLVANSVATCVVNVAYDVATEVVCTFDRGAKAPLRLLSVFVHPDGADKLLNGPTPELSNDRAMAYEGAANG